MKRREFQEKYSARRDTNHATNLDTKHLSSIGIEQLIHEEFPAHLKQPYLGKLFPNTPKGPTRTIEVARFLCALVLDALLFLAGIWTSPTTNAKYNTSVIKYVALRHALAFLRAQSAGSVDFQTIIPALLVALQSVDRQVRSAAVECLDVLANVVEGTKPASIYALDRVYGAASGNS